MPKATAVWLVDNTSLSFDQIAAFCGLHPLEVQGVADGDVAGGIMGVNPLQNGQLTRDEIEKADSNAEMPSITSNGRFVSFQSTAKNMVTGDVNNTADIFVHDRNTGVTTVVSIAGNGAQANGFNAPIHSISGDGGFIAFESVANNLVQNDTNNSNDIFVARGGPNSPTNLTVSDLTSTSLKLTWDDNASNETGYEVERRRGTSS